MILAIVQARMSSNRLPEKVLAPIGNQPMLSHVADRTQQAARLDQLIVATSTDRTDEPIARFCESAGLDCHRGSLDDVLDRYYQAARARGASVVVRVTGDCPLIDPAVIDRVICRYQQGGHDYVSNTLTPTYPDGLDTEVFSFEALETAWREATLASEREHVTPFIKTRPDRFRLHNVRHTEDLSEMRWTVDEPSDLTFARAIHDRLGDAAFDMQAVVDLLRAAPELLQINAGIQRDAGYRASLEAERGQSR